MDIICEGSYSNPTRCLVNGQEITLDAEKWSRAYNTALSDMGIPEDDPSFLAAVYEIYSSL